MPRRTVTKCGRRRGVDRIDTLDEIVLCEGHAWGVRSWETALDSMDTLAALWRRWGEQLTARWREAYPGSRPMGAYLTGQIAPPDHAHERPALRLPVRVAGEIVIADRRWHEREEELEHLAALGIVGDREYDLALTRLDAPAMAHRRYRPLASPNE